MTRSCNSFSTHYWRIIAGIGTSGTPRKCWNSTVALRQGPVRGPGGIWSSWKETRNSQGNETQTMRIKDLEEAPPLFSEPVLDWFVLQKNGLEACYWQREGTDTNWIR